MLVERECYLVFAIRPDQICTGTTELSFKVYALIMLQSVYIRLLKQNDEFQAIRRVVFVPLFQELKLTWKANDAIVQVCCTTFKISMQRL
jgi:hypothetical protein